MTRGDDAPPEVAVAEAVPELVWLAVGDDEAAVVALAAAESVVVADDAVPVVAVPVPVDDAAVAVEDVLSVMPQTASTSKSPKGMFLASHSAVCRTMESAIILGSAFCPFVGLQEPNELGLLLFSCLPGKTDSSHFSAMQQK